MLRKLLFFIIIVFIVGIAWFVWFDHSPLNNDAQDSIEIRINGYPFTMLVADTAAAQQQGLSDRDDLGSYDGMIFIFDPAQTNLTFWMKNMRFDLDMVWVSGGTIVQIDRNVPYPIHGEEPALRHSPENTPISAVIEVQAGHVQSWKIGDVVTFDY